MPTFKGFKARYPELFRYQTATVIHPHDTLLNRVFLRFMPEWITPNQVTMFRIYTTPIVFLLTLFGQYRIGIVAFMLVAFTDAIDGSLARTRNKITQFGMLFDPLADKFLIGSMILVLVFQYFPVYLGFTILIIEVILIIVALIAGYKFKIVRMANVWGKLKMILQVCAVFLTLAALLLNAPSLFSLAAWLFGLAIGFAIVSLFAHGI